MIKRAASRNPRSKRVKVKHVLQICLLLGICFWLIYQVKRSHDKKKEFEEKEVKGISDDGFLKLGRKDPLNSPELTKNDKHKEDEEEELGTGDEVLKEEEHRLQLEQEEAEMKHREEEEEEEEPDGESKHEVKEQEEDSKREEMEDEEGRGGGDDEMDERDQDKIEGEADHDEEAAGADRERQEEGEEEETGTTDVEDKIQLDHESLAEDQDQDEGDKNAHEAQEELYKADDASSAVTHDTPILTPEPKNVSTEHSDNPIEGASGDHNNQTLLLEQGSTAANVSRLNTTALNDERLLAKSEDKPNNGATSTSLSNNQSLLSNTSSGVSTEAGIDKKVNNIEISDSSQHDETKVTSEPEAHDATVNGSTSENVPILQNTELKQENNKASSDPDSNFPRKTEDADTVDRASSNSTTYLESDLSDTKIKPEVTAEGEVGSGLSLTAKDSTDATHNPENTNESVGTDENPGDSTTDSKGESGEINDPIDTSDSSIGQDEKENRLDLSTLPENTLDGVNDRNTAAE